MPKRMNKTARKVFDGIFKQPEEGQEFTAFLGGDVCQGTGVGDVSKYGEMFATEITKRTGVEHKYENSAKAIMPVV